MPQYLGLVPIGNQIGGTIATRNASNTPTDPTSAPTFRVYGPGSVSVMLNGTGSLTKKDTGSVSNATGNAVSPIQITSNGHGLTTGSYVTVGGVGGNTAANVTGTITAVDANNFTEDGTTGNGAYTSGGTWNVTGLWNFSFTPTLANGFVQGTTYTAYIQWTISGTTYSDTFTFTVV